ncbi:MAG TPA: endonuclease/exonuclease/phosphatase family protein [Verrucomicrobiales bacterium]|jgi:exonuclease III|nr:endonuclease/exonuclease/phosphatase family protein [Verrucomicrobiales bacterium]
MDFRFASWNVNNRKLTASHIDLLRLISPDILVLQEASSAFHTALQASGLFASDVSSLALRPPQAMEGRSRRLGCSIFTTSRFQSCNPSLLSELHFPERTLAMNVSTAGWSGMVCSFHTPPGASWGRVKPRTLKAISQWLTLQPGPLIFGIDANCPKTDHPDISQNEWWWKDEPLLLGGSPLHQLRDVFRVYLEKNPHEFARIRADRPAGPLAVSHVRGNRRTMTECRYDFIYASPDVEVHSACYMFDESIRAVSDHAVVVAHLRAAHAAA